MELLQQELRIYIRIYFRFPATLVIVFALYAKAIFIPLKEKSVPPLLSWDIVQPQCQQTHPSIAQVYLQL
jgi:hypothetical protein